MSFTTFTAGRSESFGGRFPELVPDERIRHTDAFDDPHLPGERQAVITLKTASCGAEVHIVLEGLPDAIPPKARGLGGQESLSRLARPVEPEIKAQQTFGSPASPVRASR